MILAEEIFYIWSSSFRRQERTSKIQSIKLSVNNASEAIHLYNANEIGWGMEPNSIQLVRLYQKSIWQQLYRDFKSDYSRKLQN